MRRIYIAHPYSDNPIKNREANKLLIKRLSDKNPDCLFVSPLLLFDYLEDDGGIREDIMCMCEDMLILCEELWYYGDSDGTLREVVFANKNNIIVKKGK